MLTAASRCMGSRARPKSACVYLLMLAAALTSALLYATTSSPTPTMLSSGAFRFRQFLTSSLAKDRVTSFSTSTTMNKKLTDGATKTTTTTKLPKPKPQPRPQQPTSKCGNVFPDMLHGRWVPKQNVTPARRNEVEDFLAQMHGEFRLPRSLQRPDGRCASLGFEHVRNYPHMPFRALCGRHGPTPCCKDYRCVDLSPQQCTCPTCLDTRTRVHAELSDWVPEKPGCAPRIFRDAREACEVLKGSRLVLAGDSFVRHMFVALVMLLTGDFAQGALKRDAPPEILRHCRGMVQINGLRCRAILNQTREDLCNGTVNVTYHEIFPAMKGGFLLPYLKKLEKLSSSSGDVSQRLLMLLGVGIHDQFRASVVWPLFLHSVVEHVTGISIPSAANLSIPFVHQDPNPFRVHPPEELPPIPDFYANLRSSSLYSSTPPRKRPKMIWLNSHAPGMLKSPVYQYQTEFGVRFYNAVIGKLLEPYGVPVLDSFNMTSSLLSVDGTHYGYGANIMKVQFLLNWVLERKERGEW